ncbi:MAG TPA: acyl-CoA dehydrogenase family protein [Rhizomicrobium sp.]|jgi:alkylation response protein AidB-like acyl-CoA dehydrogenase|nr:acyl-CoA dehydrogenase family protein [Rhizomicrobium sp.]
MSAAAHIDHDLESFRAEARAWIDANFPKSLKGKDALSFMEGFGSKDPDFLSWKKAMGEKGWGIATWPKPWGGGLSKPQGRVLMQELARAGAFNPIGGMGVAMFGPTLLEYGNDAQKTRHMPGIQTGTVRWCQGYSEPGAGSDLAALRTQAIDKGDHFLVNGQKIWTSGAQYADWCFCLVRTDNTKKHEGISFLLIDMKSPGVETRPIKLISGNSPFCETFFTDVKVPKENLMGPLNGGWTVGKRLLQFERDGQGGNARGASFRGADLRSLDEIAKAYVGNDSHGRIADADLRVRVADHMMDAAAMRLTVQRMQDDARAAQGPSAVTSIMKNANVKVNQTRAELLIEIMGFQGLGWEGDTYARNEIDATRNWLSGKAQSIYGGSNEIQSNIIAKRILGLLDHQ